MLGLSFSELALLAFIGIIFLKPAELRRMAHTAGRWMSEVQRMSREFSRELVREADMQDLRDEARKLKHEVKGLLAPIAEETRRLADEKRIPVEGESEQAEGEGYQPAFPEAASPAEESVKAELAAVAEPSKLEPGASQAQA